jgi:hypothetical protein
MVTTLSPHETQTPAGRDEPARAPKVRQAGGVLGDLKPTLLTVTALILIVVIAVGVALALHTQKSAGDIRVRETDYRIAMPDTLRAGKHTIALTNNGAQPHELLLFRTDLSAKALPVDANGNVIEESPLLHKVIDSGQGLGAGATQIIPTTLPPGHYVAVCNLPAHYRSGMRLDVTVTR